MGDQALMQLAGEQGDAIDTCVMAEPMAGHAHLAATTGFQVILIEVGPSVDGDLAGGRITAQATGWNVGGGHSRCQAEVLLYEQE